MFSISDLSVLSATRIQLSFNAPLPHGRPIYTSGSYAIAGRFGDLPPAQVKVVEAPTAGDGETYTVILNLRDRLVAHGHYQLVVSDFISPYTQEKVSNAPWFFTAPDGGQHKKTLEIKKHLPSMYNKEYGSFIEALLFALGESDHRTAGSDFDCFAQYVKDSMFIDSADTEALTNAAKNYGLTRSSPVENDDEQYRQLLPILAWGKKGTLGSIRRALAILLADADWDVYEINPGELVVEATLTGTLGSARTLPGGTYAHQDATVVGGSSYMGDYIATNGAQAGTTVGGNIVVVAGTDNSGLTGVLKLLKAAGVVVRLTQRGS